MKTETNRKKTSNDVENREKQKKDKQRVNREKHTEGQTKYKE